MSHEPAKPRLALLARAVDDAVAVRGTVVLAVPSAEQRWWCAVLAACQGDLELRVGEPRRWRRRHRAGERWLADHGFTHRMDAWVLPARPGAGPRECAAILAAALEHGLGVPGDAPLQRTLVQPGAPEPPAAPPPDAGHEAHLAAALALLAPGGPDRMFVECGRPARPLAWVWLVGGELVIEVATGEAPGEASGEERELGRFTPDPAGSRQAAAALARALRDDLGVAPGDPLFLSLLG